MNTAFRKIVAASLYVGLLAGSPALAQTEQALRPDLPRILPERERADLKEAWLKERLDTLVPKLMREQKVDMWVLVAREYAEDPVLLTMLDGTTFNARRRTILVFWDPGDGRPVERLVISKHGMTDFQKSWDMAKQPDQWKRFAEVVHERKPHKIALNTSPESAFSDGLTHSQYTALVAALTPEERTKIVSSYPLATAWLETRLPSEMQRYPEILRAAHAIIAEGFSDKVVKPGVTTPLDLEWWFRQRTTDLGLTNWSQPTVRIFRKGAPGSSIRDANTVIQKGDMLHVDLCLLYLNLRTDMQHVAYVLRDGETDAPAGLKAGLLAANGVQDAITSEFHTGVSGNEILARARAKATAAGLAPWIYSHPIGFYGHSAGSAIGLSEEQKFVPQGEYRLRPDIMWSIESRASKAVPEWDNLVVNFETEEDAFFDGQAVSFPDGRQTKFHLIKSE
ncbi:M24 family metallopeptidase [soil metagenome]